MVERRLGAFLDEIRGAGGIVFDQHADRLEQRRGHDHPAQPPAGHAPGLGEAVDADDAVLIGRQRQERRGRRLVEGQALIDIVAEQPGPMPTAAFEDRRPIRLGQHPAGGIVRRVEDQQPGVGRQGVHQAIEVEAPAALGGFQGNHLNSRRQDPRNLRHVGPDRADHHSAVARRDHRLGGELHCIDPGADDGQPFGADRLPVQARQIGRERIAQIGAAQVVGVVGSAVQQGPGRRLADEVGRRLVGFAEPEGQDIIPAQAGIRHLADLGPAEI